MTEPKVRTIVHVLRHGEVNNPGGILYGRLPGFTLSVTGRAQAVAVANALAEPRHHPRRRLPARTRPADRWADRAGTRPDRAHRRQPDRGRQLLRGPRFAVGDGALRKPKHWLKLRDPFTPSWGEPYIQIAHRMLAAVNKARAEAAGHEAVCVSHQLPVWTLRRFLQGDRLWHDPRRRQCSLASLTSLVYVGDTLVDIVYSEPAGASDPTVTGA